MRLTFIAVLLSICCSEAFAQQTVTGSFMHGGQSRTYRMYVPASYTAGTAVPLVFNLHGYGSNNLQQEGYGDFRSIADTANFIVVHPNGTLDGNSQMNWNSFGLTTVDDVGFISRLIDTIAANYSIDLNRVYSTGMSNGGYMSYHLACNLNQRITAVASVTGSMTNFNMNACSIGRPTPIMQIHGTADPTVPYNGNTSSAAIETLVQHWAALNNCNMSPIVTAVPNTIATDGCTATHYLYDNGNSGATVEFYKITDGGHTWPGAPVVIGVTNMDINASVEIWRFFSQFSRQQLLQVVDEASPHYTVFPNPSSGTIHLSFNAVAQRVIRLVNALGQQVAIISTFGEQLEWQLNVPVGMYVVMVEENGYLVTQKICIE
jgi:polyhydroxybutyrate depolymerase